MNQDYLNSFIHHPQVILERGKVSRVLIDQAAAAGMTFGCETEFYVKGIRDLFKKYLTQNTTLDSQDRIIKKLVNVEWSDVLVAFEPIGLGEKERLMDNDEVIQRRLAFVYKKASKSDILDSPMGMFNTLKAKYSIGPALMLLGFYPTNGFRVERSYDLRMRREMAAFRNAPSEALMNYAKQFNQLGFILLPKIKDRDKMFFDLGTPERRMLLELLANIISKYLGETVVANSEPDHNAVASEGYTRWVLTVDASLHKDDSQHVIGVELISPVTDINTGFRHVEKIFNLINHFGQAAGNPKLSAFTDETTGFHVNLGLGKKKIDMTKLLFLIDDEYLINKFKRYSTNHVGSRIDNEHARNSFEHMMNNIRRNPTDFHQIISTVEKTFPLSEEDIKFILDKLSSAIVINKTMTVNFEKLAKHHFVEFRVLGNADYQDKFDDITGAIKTFATMMYAASDPHIYRKEYLTKVFNVLKGMSEYYNSNPPQSGAKTNHAALEEIMKLDHQFASRLSKKNHVVARRFADINEILNRYRRDGFMSMYKFKAASNNLLSSVRDAMTKAHVELTPIERMSLDTYVKGLRRIADHIKKG